MIQPSSHTEHLIALLYPKLSHPKKSRFTHFFTEEDSPKDEYQYPIYSLTPSFNHKPKSRLAISIENIDTGIDTRTSVMIKNIPISLSQEKTIMWILSICKADYIYIPIDQNEKKTNEQLREIKSSLDDNLKVMFNFSYEGFLNKESESESKKSFDNNNTVINNTNDNEDLNTNKSHQYFYKTKYDY